MKEFGRFGIAEPDGCPGGRKGLSLVSSGKGRFSGELCADCKKAGRVPALFSIERFGWVVREGPINADLAGFGLPVEGSGSG